jgi:hypothetical protein
MMIMRLITFTLVFGAALSQTGQMDESPRHVSFSLVRGSAGFVSSETGGTMTDAPYAVLAFTSEDGHRTLVMTDTAGDYTSVLQPGHYCLSAYHVKTGDFTLLDPRQLKCIDVLVGKDVRLDVMLARTDKEKRSPNQTMQKSKAPDSSPNH